MTTIFDLINLIAHAREGCPHAVRMVCDQRERGQIIARVLERRGREWFQCSPEASAHADLMVRLAERWDAIQATTAMIDVWRLLAGD